MLASAALVQAASVPKVLRPSPELVVKLTGGEQLLLSKFRGKVVALEILLTTCPHCQRCSSIMNKLYAELGPKGFQPLGAAINEGAENLVPGFIYNLGLKFPVGVANREMAYEYLQVKADAGPVYMPTLVFIDRKGNIRGQFFGDNDFFKNEEQNVRTMIEALLAEGTAPPARAKKK
ncbi:MAG: TlpA family protein disulfide reductase [Bryobacterales bacterium]|nr:TlpA family protein disulfide reductase [Bryobacterales bacterium]